MKVWEILVKHYIMIRRTSSTDLMYNKVTIVNIQYNVYNIFLKNAEWILSVLITKIVIM